MFEHLLKILMKLGYPNPQLSSIMRAISYNGEFFLEDLVKKFDYRGAEEFVRKALDKLSEPNTQDYTIKIPLEGYVDSYVELIIYDFYIDDEESETDIVINYGWGKSRIVNPEDGTVKTLEDILDDADLGGFNEYEDFIDSLRTDAYNYVAERCGFGIWYQ